MKAKEHWDSENVSDIDSHNLYIRAIESMQDSIAYNIRYLKEQRMCYVQSRKVSLMASLATNYDSALRILKDDYKLSKELNAGKYRMPERIRRYVYGVTYWWSSH